MSDFRYVISWVLLVIAILLVAISTQKYEKLEDQNKELRQEISTVKINYEDVIIDLNQEINRCKSENIVQ
jgi:hypothetical protein